MNEGRRAYDMLRGYIGQEWERIRGVPGVQDPAEIELNEAMDGPQFPAREVGDERLASEVLGVSDDEIARKILGVGPRADFREIRSSFDRLNKRSDPNNFPTGSPEASQASEIRARVNKAYRILSERFDSTEKRFRSLEIE